MGQLTRKQVEVQKPEEKQLPVPFVPRSLGASLQFATSDISCFKKVSQAEADTILSNANSKVMLKIS